MYAGEGGAGRTQVVWFETPQSRYAAKHDEAGVALDCPFVDGRHTGLTDIAQTAYANKRAVESDLEDLIPHAIAVATDTGSSSETDTFQLP